jgi:hypothetical protein
MKKIISLALAITALASAYAPKADAHGSAPGARRGTVFATGPGTKAVTVGPVVFHGYSGFPGGAIFLAPAATGTDADCAAAAGQGSLSRTTLIADRIEQISVGPGQVACLVTDTKRPFELLWHALPTK